MILTSTQAGGDFYFAPHWLPTANEAQAGCVRWLDGEPGYLLTADGTVFRYWQRKHSPSAVSVELLEAQARRKERVKMRALLTSAQCELLAQGRPCGVVQLEDLP